MVAPLFTFSPMAVLSFVLSTIAPRRLRSAGFTFKNRPSNQKQNWDSFKRCETNVTRFPLFGSSALLVPPLQSTAIVKGLGVSFEGNTLGEHQNAL